MQNFLSTLAQIIASLIGIFLASITAYFIFMQERSAQYTERITQSKLEIRDTLTNLRKGWPRIELYLPVGFNDLYRSKYSEKPNIEILMKAASDLQFNSAEIEATIAELKNQDSLGKGNFWKGRVYFWTLSGFVSLLSGGTVDNRINVEGVFPQAPTGPGFDQWKGDFERLRGTFFLLQDFRENMAMDFGQFVENIPTELKHNPGILIDQFNNGTGEFFKDINSINAKLEEIHKQELSREPYTISSRLNLYSLVILALLAVALGVILPLGILASDREITTITAFVILFSSLLAIGGLFYQFVWDISKPAKYKDYIAVRWYLPLLKEMERQKPNLENGGMVDLEFLYNARNSEEQKYFSKEVLKALNDYIKVSEDYNKKTEDFNSATLEIIQNDTVIGVAGKNYKSLKGGVTLYPDTFLDDAKWKGFIQTIPGGSSGDISFEFLMQRWTTIKFKIPGHEFVSTPGRLVDSLESIRKLVRKNEQSKHFLEAKKNVLASGDQFKQKLASSIGKSKQKK